MKETLTIKNFGPIKDITIELGKVNVLIGEQATGKSTVAKVIELCKDFRISDENWEIIHEHELNSYFSDSSKIYFESSSYSLTISINKIEFVGKENIVEDWKRIKYLTKIVEEKANEFEAIYSEKWQLEDKVYNVMGSSVYYPAERILVPLLGGSSLGLVGEKSLLFNYQFKLFARRYENARKLNFENNFTFLGLEYEFLNSKEILTLENGFKLELKDSASGYQSAITLLVPYRYFITSNKVTNIIHLIEEPEMNLFPKTQLDVCKEVASRVNDSLMDRVLITTHSPYILTSINNLIYAWQVGQNQLKRVNSIIPSGEWLNPSDVSAYYLSNGKAESIIDKETGLIEANRIDSVSDIINKEFNDLFEIERISEK